MKSFFKRSVIGMIVLGMAGSSYAAMSHNTHNHHNNNGNGHENGNGNGNGNGYGVGYVSGGGYANGCCNGNYYSNNYMWMPHFTGFFIGAEGLDLRPQNDDLDFVNAGTTTDLSIVSTPFITAGIRPSFEWNWRVYAGFTFSDCDDITFSWFHLDNDDHNNFVSALDQPLFVRFLFFDTDFDGIRARAEFDVTEAYVVWGHTIKFNNPWRIRFAGGVEYARVDSDLTVTATSEEDEVTPFLISNTAHSHTRGWGPRVEFDATYQFPCTSFSWFAKTNAALLASRRRIDLEAFDNDPDTSPNVFSATWTRRHIVVPKFGIRLGIAYSGMWGGGMWGQMGGEGCGGCGTFFSVEAGWQADAYIHAIERPEHGFNNVNEDQEFLFATTTRSNFTDQGWFIGLKVGMGWL